MPWERQANTPLTGSSMSNVYNAERIYTQIGIPITQWKSLSSSSKQVTSSSESYHKVSFTFTQGINYDLNQLSFWHASQAFQNHETLMKVSIILRSKRIEIYRSNLLVLLVILLQPRSLRSLRFLKLPTKSSNTVSILERYWNDLRRHDCKSFSPDLFSRSYIYTHTHTACSKLIFVSSASFLAGSFSPRACTRCWHGYKVTGEANRTSDESQLVEISSTNITRRALIALDGREAAALRREIARLQPFYFAFLLVRFFVPSSASLTSVRTSLSVSFPPFGGLRKLANILCARYKYICINNLIITLIFITVDKVLNLGYTIVIVLFKIFINIKWIVTSVKYISSLLEYYSVSRLEDILFSSKHLARLSLPFQARKLNYVACVEETILQLIILCYPGSKSVELGEAKAANGMPRHFASLDR